MSRRKKNDIQVTLQWKPPANVVGARFCVGHDQHLGTVGPAGKHKLVVLAGLSSPLAGAGSQESYLRHCDAIVGILNLATMVVASCHTSRRESFGERV